MMHSYYIKYDLSGGESYVLILVLMDDALVPFHAYHTRCREYWVLILVLMDDALVLQNLGYALFKRIVRLVCAS